MSVLIKDYNKLNVLGSWTYKEIVGVEYYIDIDKNNNYSTVLMLSFLIYAIQRQRYFKIQIKYDNVSNFTLKNVTNIYLTKSLIIEEKKESGWENDKRFYIHDDSGYGERDGFNFIEFYCSSMKLLSLKHYIFKV